MGRIGRFPYSVHQLHKRLEDCKTEHHSTIALLSREWIRKGFVREANKHSVELECLAECRGKSGQELLEEMLRRQNLAWQYATEHIAPEQRYDPKDLAIIANLLAPYNRYHPETGFRVEDVKLNHASHYPPDPQRVPQEINDLITRSADMPPLCKAIYSHFHIARIHPFADGNGRTARMVQNAIMCGAGYLPIPVHVEQRGLYITLLDEAAAAYYNGDRQYLHTFSEFMVSNLKTTMKRARKHPLAKMLL